MLSQDGKVWETKDRARTKIDVRKVPGWDLPFPGWRRKRGRRSPRTAAEDHDERDVATPHGAHVFAGHITRSHATSMWDYFGLHSMLFQSEVAQERAGHTKETFERSYCRIIPESILERWKLHGNSIYLSPDEILFI